MNICVVVVDLQSNLVLDIFSTFIKFVIGLKLISYDHLTSYFIISPYLNCVQSILFVPYLCHTNSLALIMFNKSNKKETMTNQQLKNKVILSMKKDNDLKKYVKDMQELSNESFDILVKIIDGAYNKVKGVK